jgi:hypothetical protein
MKPTCKPIPSSRRGFLRRIALLGGAGGLATLAVDTVTAAETAAAADADVPTTAKRGYHETDHIRTYYQKADF